MFVFSCVVWLMMNSWLLYMLIFGSWLFFSVFLIVSGCRL